MYELAVAVGEANRCASDRRISKSWSDMLDALAPSDDAASAGAANNAILKSGPLFIPSKKGLGWKSWRKRWFILNKTSLVFLKRDPSLQSGGEVNLILGGIVLNNSGSVVVRQDKKLLIISFPDLQDGRPFALKTESSEDLHEWITALEHALKQAPCPAPAIVGSFCPWKAKHSAKPRFVGSPNSLALQEADGGPSFLEKALCFLEEFGTKVEGVLRISADLEEVQRRFQEYEQGKTEFDPNEDAHVVGDCVKHILREHPSSLIPVCCCNELLKVYEIDQNEAQINAFRVAILKKLPEPNQCLFKRILKMMYAISCTPENRMSPSAIAACMAPLLLRPILAGECNLTDNGEYSDDNSALLFAAANAARTAQAIITLILEDYLNIFSAEKASDDPEKNNGNEDLTDAEILEKINIGNLDAESITDSGKYENYELSSSEELSRSSTFGGSDVYDNMDFNPNLNLVSGSYDLPSSESRSILVVCKHAQSDGSQLRELLDQHQRGNKMPLTLFSALNPSPNRKRSQSIGQILSTPEPIFPSPEPETCSEKSSDQLASSSVNSTMSSLWEKVCLQVKKLSSAGSLDSRGLKKLDVRQLEKKKNDLQQRLADEAKLNELLQASLARKQPLIQRLLVEKLQARLQTERGLRLMAEFGLNQRTQLSNLVSMKRAEPKEIAIAEGEVARLKQKAAELRHQLRQLVHQGVEQAVEG
ncbi:hypothetical protein QQ045_027546 [Rhodiola kirilowii]